MAETNYGSVEKGRPINTPAQVAVFAHSGGYWTVGYAGATSSLKDIKGLGYIHRLLRYPGEEFHALDLLAEPGRGSAPDGGQMNSLLSEPSITIGGLGDAGEMLDEQAKRDYKRRLLELRERAEDLIERGDRDRASEVESEIEFLEREIARAVGLGGRDRRAGSAAERARLNVTRAIKAALQKISDQHAALGTALDSSIRTGSFCSYIPDWRIPISWQFSVEGPATCEAAKPSATNDAKSTSYVKRETGLLQSFIQGTTFVGREPEFATLRQCLEQSSRGEGRLVLISGSPGVGKTRIAAEIGAEASNRGALMFVGGCYDREDSVPFVPFVEILEVALARAASPESFRELLGQNASEVARLSPEIRRLFPEIPAPLELTPEQSRRALFNAVSEILARLSENGPAVLFFDDLQWADEGTLSLLTHLARLVPKMAVLVVVAYRDMELDPARPLVKALAELIRLQFCQQIRLGGLQRNAVAAMLQSLSGRKVPEELVNLIYTATEGNPFFIEELFRHLVEQGKLFDSAGGFRFDLKADEIDLPSSLRVVIGRRLARLSEEAQKVLATAGVIGRTFPFRLLEASTGVDPEWLLDRVEEAERAGLINSTVEYPEAKFYFSHELVRRATIDTLSPVRRQRIHLGIANGIEALGGSWSEEHAGDLAYHLWQSGSFANPERTILALAAASRQALKQASYDAAVQHSRNALDRFESLSTSDKTKLTLVELELQTIIGSALMPSKGYASIEVEKAFTRAKEICATIDSSPAYIPVLLGLGIFFLVRAKFDVVQEVCGKALNIAETVNDSPAMMESQLRLAIADLYLGKLESGLNRGKRVLSLYNPQIHQLHAAIYGQNPAMAARVCAGCILWLLGFPEQARSSAEAGIQIANEIQHSLSTVYACVYTAMMYGWLSEYQRSEELLRTALIICEQEGFTFWSAVATVFHGSSLANRGQHKAGIAEIAQGLENWALTGAVAPGAYLTLLMAQAQLKSGDFDEAESNLEKAAKCTIQTGERFLEAEIYRIRGELILAHRESSSSSLVKAEEQFRKAIDISRRQQAKSLELRATVSMAQLLRRRQRSEPAYVLLRAIYCQFSEGFNTLDLQNARALLERLSETRG